MRMDNKFWIIGPPGAGKSWLSKNICMRNGCKHVELDNIYWLKAWSRRSKKEFRDIVEETLNSESWVVDGYYNQVNDLILVHEPTVVLLKNNIIVLLIRVLLRSLTRILFRKKVCGNNYETIYFAFSKEGIIKYTVEQYKFFKNMTIEGYGNIFIIESKRAMKKFLKYL